MIYGVSPFSIATQMGAGGDWQVTSLALLEMGLRIPEHLNGEDGPVTQNGIDLLQKLLHIDPMHRISMKVRMRSCFILCILAEES